MALFSSNKISIRKGDKYRRPAIAPTRKSIVPKVKLIIIDDDPTVHDLINLHYKNIYTTFL